ncbi:MAG: class I SAM-dependent methyltransferase [Erysipelotrichaceae bacterium]|nr:class I SAM-dependent methyltransferase [Erysipelotrichaceae bacterium]
MEKIHIEKNSVQETLMIPLYGRKLSTEVFPDLYRDETAKELCEKVDFDFSSLEKKSQNTFYRFGALEAAMRQLDIQYEIREYLNSYPKASVVNMGCGLDNTGRTVDNGQIRIYNVDFEDTMAAREQLLPAGQRETNLATDLNALTWMDRIDGTNGVIFFAAGVFHYLKTEEVKTIILEIEKRFPHARLVFDTVGVFGHRMMMKGVLKNFGITDVSGYFHVEDPVKELRGWSDRITVSQKGYMCGYYDLNTQGVTGFHRLLAKIGDHWMKMNIVRIDFQ